MKMNSTLRAILFAASLVVGTGAADARSANMLELGRQQIVTTDAAPMSVDAVRKAIIAGGATHTWKAIDDRPGVLTLEADSGQHRVMVDVAYDAQSYQITYKSSANMNYEQSGARTTIHPKYNKWIEDLSTSIRSAALSLQVQAK
jgi:hypothetical protein